MGSALQSLTQLGHSLLDCAEPGSVLHNSSVDITSDHKSATGGSEYKSKESRRHVLRNPRSRRSTLGSVWRRSYHMIAPGYLGNTPVLLAKPTIMAITF